MEIIKSNKELYNAPYIIDMGYIPSLNLLSALSAYGNILDLEEGGDYEGEYTDPLD